MSTSELRYIAGMYLALCGPICSAAAPAFDSLRTDWCTTTRDKVAIRDIRETPDGGFILGGREGSAGSYHAVWARLGADGRLLWIHTGEAGQEIKSVGLLARGYLLAASNPDRILIADSSGNPIGRAVGGRDGILRPLSDGKWLTFRLSGAGDGPWEALTLDRDGALAGAYALDSLLPFDAIALSGGGAAIGGHSRVMGAAPGDSFCIRGYSAAGARIWSRMSPPPLYAMPTGLKFLPGSDDSLYFIRMASFESEIRDVMAMAGNGNSIPGARTVSGGFTLLAGMRSARGELIVGGSASRQTEVKAGTGLMQLYIYEDRPVLGTQQASWIRQPALYSLAGARLDTGYASVLDPPSFGHASAQSSAFLQVIPSRDSGYVAVGDFQDTQGRTVLAAKISGQEAMAIGQAGPRSARYLIKRMPSDMLGRFSRARPRRNP